MKQKFFKFLTSKQIRKRSESSTSSSQEETLLANAISSENCHICLIRFANDNESKTGVPLICTFDKCPYNHRSIHRACFDILEKENIHYLKHCGKKTAKWTESKILKVMWKKQGLRLLKRRLRCPCNCGYFCKDLDAYYEMKKVEEEDSGYMTDSDELIEEEPLKVEDIKTTFDDHKKALKEQSFNPFEAEQIPEEAVADDLGDDSGGEHVAQNVKSIFDMY